MPPGDSILLQDTCALIDFLALDLMRSIRESGRRIYISEFVYSEIVSAHQRTKVDALIAEGLVVVDNEPDEHCIADYKAQFKGLSIADCSMIDLAQRVSGIVVTTDDRLKRVCLSLGFDVHGVLWVIDVMVAESFVNVGDAIAMLDRYAQVNKRAPRQLIEELKQKLTTG